MLITRELMEMCRKNYELREPCTNCRHSKGLCLKIKNMTDGMTPFDIGLENGFKNIHIKEGEK